MIIRHKKTGKYYRFISISEEDLGWKLYVELIINDKKRQSRQVIYYGLDKLIAQLQKFEEVSPGEIRL